MPLSYLEVLKRQRKRQQAEGMGNLAEGQKFIPVRKRIPQYDSIHQYIRYHFEQPKHCQNCKKIKKLDWANFTGVYDKDIRNYKAFCRPCHKLIDSGGTIGYCKNGHRRIKSNIYVAPSTKYTECIACRKLHHNISNANRNSHQKKEPS